MLNILCVSLLSVHRVEQNTQYHQTQWVNTYQLPTVAILVVVLLTFNGQDSYCPSNVR